MDRMTRRGILKTVSGFAAGLFLRRKSAGAAVPEQSGQASYIRVEMKWEKSYVLPWSPEHLSTIELPIGRRHFVNDVAFVLKVSREERSGASTLRA